MRLSWRPSQGKLIIVEARLIRPPLLRLGVKRMLVSEASAEAAPPCTFHHSKHPDLNRALGSDGLIHRSQSQSPPQLDNAEVAQILNDCLTWTALCRGSRCAAQ